MEEELGQFLCFLQEKRFLSENTLSAYKNDINQFLEFLRSSSENSVRQATPAKWSSVSSSHVRAYLANLKERSYADTTVARKLASLKSFFTYLDTNKLTERNPTQGLPSMGIRRTSPKTLSALDVEIILAQPSLGNTPVAKRDQAMLWLLYSTGMRVTELVKLDVDDVFLEDVEPHVRCVGRGGRPRNIPVQSGILSPIQEYLGKDRSTLLKSPIETALFLNRRGERLTRQGLWLIIKNYARAADLKVAITPHTLRHSFAAHSLRSGRLSLSALQRTLGHASISSTQVYIRLADETQPSTPLA
ncbi:MAG: xerD [Dehalococcoidia bacterium]|nr:xerD [Dehalococcoidia bacterium]